MKKLLLSILLMAFCVTVFSETNAQTSQKTFKIHSEKRMFVKKGMRHHGKHNHHGRKNLRMGNKKKLMENHKK